MWKKHVKTWLLACLLFSGIAVPAGAQVLQPFGPVDVSPDFDLFAPFVIDHFDPRPRPNEGLFFSYERVDWSISAPKRRVVGAGRDVSSILVYKDSVFPTPNTLNDGLDVHVPNADWAWGNRFDLGYIVDNRGWGVSVLAGLDQPDRTAYGFEATTSPFGTVSVTFDHADGLLDGFIDQRQPEATDPGGLGGPDGFADDLDGDTVHGPDGADTGGDGTPDTLAPTDFDDLVTFLVSFDSMIVRSSTKVSGVELMKLFRFEPLHNKTFFEFGVGARYLSIEDRFDVNGHGGWIGDSNWGGDAENHIVGPQLSLRFQDQRDRWKFVAEGRFMAGYNTQNLEVKGAIGHNLRPGDLNQPLYFNPTTFRHVKTEDRFSPVAEMRLETAYVLTKSVAIKVGWTGIFAGKIARGSDIIEYTLPEPGLLSSAESVFTNGVNFGIEINR